MNKFIKESLDTAELENSNLRKHLLWCAQFLPKDKLAELKKRLELSLDDGGVTANYFDEVHYEQMKFKQLAQKAADLLERAVHHADPTFTKNQVSWFKEVLDKGNWFGLADDLVSALRDFEPEPTGGLRAEVEAMSEDPKTT